MAYENILTETHGPAGLIRLNRSGALNAVSSGMIAELGEALDGFEADESVGAVVMMGDEKAFAAGADVNEMYEKTFVDAYLEDFLAGGLERITRCRKPVVAAVSGYALGVGCELAMMCDFIIAADNARFGQPEITLGTMPGGGGTQRLARAVGKAKAMEMCLTGRNMDADEAERAGLVSRIVPLADLKTDALRTATRIASMSGPVTVMIKEAVNRADEIGLSEGILHERRLFQATFGMEDQKEGMAAFLEKRQPYFRNA